jgi:hypothetical protein
MIGQVCRSFGHLTMTIAQTLEVGSTGVGSMWSHMPERKMVQVAAADATFGSGFDYVHGHGCYEHTRVQLRTRTRA